jgi:hypothetical protein
MAALTMQWSGNGVPKLTIACQKLSSGQKANAFRRALNHTGDKVYTIVLRTLSDQIGAPQAVIRRYGKIIKLRANNAALTYTIRAAGGPIPIKHFRAYQTRKGVSAAPWKNRKTYRSAFIVPRLGGHAFWRTGRKRLPIERIAGPNVPKEMVKDASAAAFHAVTATQLPRRVEHEIRRLTDGVVS